MHPCDVSGPLIAATELLATMLTLVPTHLMILQMYQEELLCLEAPSAVPHSAEVGMGDVHLPVNLHRTVIECLESTQCT